MCGRGRAVAETMDRYFISQCRFHLTGRKKEGMFIVVADATVVDVAGFQFAPFLENQIGEIILLHCTNEWSWTQNAVKSNSFVWLELFYLKT